MFDSSDKEEKTDDVPAKQASGSKPVCVLVFVSFCGQTLSLNQFCEDILAGSLNGLPKDCWKVLRLWSESSLDQGKTFSSDSNS